MNDRNQVESVLQVSIRPTGFSCRRTAFDIELMPVNVRSMSTGVEAHIPNLHYILLHWLNDYSLEGEPTPVSNSAAASPQMLFPPCPSSLHDSLLLDNKS